MPIIELFAEVKSLGFTAIRALTNLITDNFNRSSSGGLGLTGSGFPWSAIRGTWYANGTQAQSDDAATNYSIATLQAYSQDVTASASVSGGTGVAFWVSDAGSWWAAVPYYNTYTYSLPACSCGTYNVTPSAGTYPNCNCGVTSSTPSNGGFPNCYCGSTTTTNPTGTYPSCICGSYSQTTTSCYGFSPSQCSANGGTYVGGSCGCQFTTVNYYCNSCGSTTTCLDCPTTYSCIACPTQTYCYSCGTGTGYNYYLRLLQSSGGTVSTATGDVSIGSAAAAIKVTTSGNSITARAYSDTAMTSQLGSSLTYSPASPTKGTQHGIIKAPTDYSQGSTVDDFSVGL